MRITFGIKVDDASFEAACWRRSVPRVGDLVYLAGRSWNEVYRVWWRMPNGDATVEFRDVKDPHDEGLAESLLAAGWRRA